MVKIALQVKANLENIEQLSTCGEDFRWYLKFSCTSCGNSSGKWNNITLSESSPAQRGNAVNHFTQKCKFCARDNSLTILSDTVGKLTASDGGNFKTLVAFDCRGLDPTDFSPREGWVAKSVDGGKEFQDVDLSEGEWADYCEKIGKPVGIYEIEHKFVKIK